MPNGNRIRPLAVAAGVGIIGLVVYLSYRKHEECTEFPEIYSANGPIHLTPDADIEVREFIALKLDDADVSGVEISSLELTRQAAEYIADCDWAERATIKAQQIWGSIGIIANSMKAEQLQG